MNSWLWAQCEYALGKRNSIFWNPSYITHRRFRGKKHIIGLWNSASHP